MDILTGKASMKRKQSSGLLAALNKQTVHRTSAIPLNANTPSPLSAQSQSHSHSTFPNSLRSTSSDDHSHSHLSTYTSDSPQYDSSRHHSYRSMSGSGSVHGSGGGSGGGGGGSRLSTQHEYSGYAYGSNNSSKGFTGEEKKPISPQNMKKPEDVLKLVKERMFSWSYMMQWYEGDLHWFNTVKISRSAVETFIGPSKVDQRARSFFVLGISLSALFDITSSLDFMKALLKLLEEWESWSEGTGNKGVKNLFRGQKTGRKSITNGMSDFPGGIDNAESFLMPINLPFQPDFFQVHSSTCSIIRDLYKKLLGMVLPSGNRSYIHTSSLNTDPSNLIHPSTTIHSAEIDSTFTSPISPSSQIYRSPTEIPKFDERADALQLYISGELPSDRTLIGDGQKLTPQLIDLIYKVDLKLKKQYSALLREGDALARKVLDDELSNILGSLSAGTAPIRFDYSAALSSAGNGLYSLDSLNIAEETVN